MLFTILKALSPAVLLCILSNIALAAAPDFGKMPIRDGAMMTIAGILKVAKDVFDHEAVCAATHADHVKAIQTAAKYPLVKYQKLNNKQAPPATEKSIIETVEQVAKVKMCTASNDVIAPVASFKPDKRLDTEPNLDECPKAAGLNAAKYRKEHMNEFDDTGMFIEKMFPSCNCKGVKFINDGASGIVYRVKMNVGNVERAMKISACNTLAREIGALQKLKSEPWVVQVYGWGRQKANKAKWDYYIMDLLWATVEKAKGNGMDPPELQQAARLTLEAVHLMHVKYAFAKQIIGMEGDVLLQKYKKSPRTQCGVPELA